jgi:predicted DNA-binding transcriptional regulator AlpA
MSDSANNPNPPESYPQGGRMTTRLAYRRHEAAAALGLSLRCFDRLVATKDLPQPKYAGRIPLWSAAELAAFLKTGGRS